MCKICEDKEQIDDWLRENRCVESSRLRSRILNVCQALQEKIYRKELENFDLEFGNVDWKDGKSLARTAPAKSERWREHLQDLFANETSVDLSYITANIPQRPARADLAEPPTRAEFTAAVRSLKANKASGEDGETTQR